MLRRITLLSLLGIALSGTTTGQTLKLTLNDCIRTGLERNADILRGQTEVDRSNTYKTQARGRLLPDVRAYGSWTRYDEDVTYFRTIIPITSRNSFSYGVSSNLTLFDGLGNIADVERSVLNAEASWQGYQRREETVVYTIQLKYFDILRQQQLVRVNESNLERSKKQLERIRELNLVGSVPQADVFRQQVQTGNDELALLRARNDFDNALIDLRAYLGLSSGRQIELDAGGIPDSVSDAEIGSFRASITEADDILQYALTHRSDYRQADLALQGSKKAINSAFAGHFPSVNAFARYGWNNFELKDFGEYDRFSYGLEIAFPLFSRFQVSTAVEQAQLDRISSEVTLSELERTVAADVQKALNTLTAAEKNVEITRRTLLSAREDQRIASERYNLGAGILLDLIIANANLVAAESEVVNATFSYRFSTRQVEYALGKLSY